MIRDINKKPPNTYIYVLVLSIAASREVQNLLYRSIPSDSLPDSTFSVTSIAMMYSWAHMRKGEIIALESQNDSPGEFEKISDQWSTPFGIADKTFVKQRT